MDALLLREGAKLSGAEMLRTGAALMEAVEAMEPSGGGEMETRTWRSEGGWEKLLAGEGPTAAGCCRASCAWGCEEGDRSKPVTTTLGSARWGAGRARGRAELKSGCWAAAEKGVDAGWQTTAAAAGTKGF